MTTQFELLVADDHPHLESARSKAIAEGLKLTEVSIATLDSVMQSGAVEGTGPSEWLVLADSSAPLPDADFRTLGEILPTVQSTIWLQPWNVRCHWDLFPWHECGPRVAALWSNPAPSLAVCMHRTRLRSANCRPTTVADCSSQELIWNWLIQVVKHGIDVGVSPRQSVPPEWDWKESSMARRLPKLTPNAKDAATAWLKRHVLPLRPGELIPDKRSDADSVAVKAGICQWHDWLDESHQLSQSIEGLGTHQAGDYWHAIQHRREPDYSNSKYWFRQLGKHSVFERLAKAVAPGFELVPEHSQWGRRLLKGGDWDPYAFVDLCEACAADQTQPLALITRQLQALEMHWLLAESYRDAKGRAN